MRFTRLKPSEILSLFTYKNLASMPSATERRKQSMSEIVIDPIYGQIELYPHEAKLIEKSFFQRLKHIKQLGVAFYSYPAATHTRLEHSLGVMHVASLIYDTLTKEKTQISGRETRDISSIKQLINKLKKDKYKYLVRLAALLHDLGHGPFSHSFELVLERNPRFKILKNDLEKTKEFKEIKMNNESLWNKYVPDELNKHEYFTIITCLKYRNEIEGVISELSEPDQPEFEDILKILRDQTENEAALTILARIISGDVDADRIDYLLRDTHHVGFKHSGIELYSLRRQLRLTRLNRNGKEWWTIGATENGVLFIESLLIARKYHYDRISTDENSRKYEILFVGKIEKLLEEVRPRQKRIEMLSDFFINQKDENIVVLLEKKYKKPFQELINEAVDYNCAYEVKWRQFIPHDRYDLLMIWRNGERCKEFEERLETELKRSFKVEFIVDIYYHGKFPTSLLMSAVPGYLFLYDYSLIIGDFPTVMIENGGIRIYVKKPEKECPKIAEKIERNLFSRKKDQRRLYEKVFRGQLLSLTEKIRRAYFSEHSQQKNRCHDLDSLLLLLWATRWHLKDKTFEVIESNLKTKFGVNAAEDIKQAIKRRKESLGIRSRLYEVISNSQKLCNFSYNMEEIARPKGSKMLSYHENAYEDLQTLKALGFLTEKRILQRPSEIKKRISWHAPMFIYNLNEKYVLSYVNRRTQLTKEFEELKGKIGEKVTSIVQEDVEKIYNNIAKRKKRLS